jgi:arylsulfatase A-like enzyme
VIRSNHYDTGALGPEPIDRHAASVGLFLTTVWFGLVAGWLDLASVLAQRAIHPHVSASDSRTNQHFLWMVPVADLLIFSVAVVAIFPLSKLRIRGSQCIAIRLAVAAVVWTLVLSIEGIHPIAGVVLGCGVGARVGSHLNHRVARFRRVVRVSLPVMTAGLALLGGWTAQRVASAERRATAQLPPAKPGAPNVLLIVLDTVRADCLSLHGHGRLTTPNLDRLARSGWVFAEARATAPWTSPTHGSIMTGRWPHELSIRPGVPLDGSFPTLAEVLAREGYATAGFVGNVYYCSAAYGFGRGFARYEDAYENQTVSLEEILRSSGLGRQLRRFLGESTALDHEETLARKTAAMLNRDVLGWLDDRPADRPFFVFINYYDAHRPYLFHDGPTPRFGLAALPLPEQREIDRRYLALSTARPASSDLTPEFIAEATRITREAMSLYHDSYDSCIAYLDRQVGLLLDEIGRRGILDNTLVIVTSDHGEQLGEHGLVSHGTSVYRPEVHVPLVVVPPARSSRPGFVAEPVSLRDIPATIAEIVGVGPRSPFPGRSLTRFESEGMAPSSPESPVLSELEHNVSFPEPGDQASAFRAVRSLVWGNLVFIRGDDGREELYDVLNDPEESTDLARIPRLRPAIDRFRRELDRIYNIGTDPRHPVAARP